MRHPTEILAKRISMFTLVVPGLGSTSDWGLYVNHMPERPVKAVGVIGSTGISQGRDMRTGVPVNFPGIQILVRSSSFDSGYYKAKELLDILDGIKRDEVDFGGAEIYTIHAVNRTSDILALGQNQETRLDLFSINALMSL